MCFDQSFFLLGEKVHLFPMQLRGTDESFKPSHDQKSLQNKSQISLPMFDSTLQSSSASMYLCQFEST